MTTLGAMNFALRRRDIKQRLCDILQLVVLLYLVLNWEKMIKTLKND